MEYPFLLAIMPLISALAAGNRAMLKPSERTPLTAQFIADFLAGLFVPEQVTTVLGDREVGAEFSRLPFDHLFYAGSATVGRQVKKAAAAESQLRPQRHNVKTVLAVYESGQVF